MDDDFDARFGTWLRAARKEAGLTVTELAKAIGVRHQAVSSWERGEVSVRLRHAVAAYEAIIGPVTDFGEFFDDLMYHSDSDNVVAIRQA